MALKIYVQRSTQSYFFERRTVRLQLTDDKTLLWNVESKGPWLAGNAWIIINKARFAGTDCCMLHHIYVLIGAAMGQLLEFSNCLSEGWNELFSATLKK